MDNLFRERKLVFFAVGSPAENYDGMDPAEAVAGGLVDGNFQDTQAGRDIDNRLLSLREEIMNCDLLKAEEQQEWQRKIIDAREKKLTTQEVERLESEFSDQYGDIKNLVTNYTDKVMANKESAFAYDPGKGVDVPKEYIEHFDKQNRTEQQKLWAKLDDEIKERLDLLDKILELRPDLKDKMKSLDRTSRRELLEELKQCDTNCRIYAGMLELNKDYFHDTEEYKTEFADQTAQEQKRWMRLFPQIVAERKQLVDEFMDLPKEFQKKEFFNLPSREKKEYLKNMDREIERDFDREVNNVASTTWSKDSKEFTKNMFRQVRTLKMKAELLIKMKNGEITEKDEKLTAEYKQYSKQVRGFAEYAIKEWENTAIEDKKKMLKKMEAEERMATAFTTIIDKEEKDNVISKKTKERCMKRYSDLDMSKRSFELREVIYAMADRRKLLNQYEKLDPEAKKKFKDSFYPRGHKARLQAFKEASLFDKKLEAKKDAKKAEEEADIAEKDSTKTELKKAPKKVTAESAGKLDAQDRQALIKEYHDDANKYEEQGKLEKAVTIHELTLKLDPQNAYSIKKQKEINEKIEASEVWKDAKVLEAFEASSTSSLMQEEIRNLSLLEALYEDQQQWIHESSGTEDVTRRKRNNANKFQRKVHEQVTQQTSRAYIVDDDGKMKAVHFVDINKFGNRSEDIFALEEDFRLKKANKHVTNRAFRSETNGQDTRINQAREQLDKRESNATDDLIKITQNRGKLKKKPGVTSEKDDLKLRENAKKVLKKKMKA